MRQLAAEQERQDALQQAFDAWVAEAKHHLVVATLEPQQVATKEAWLMEVGVRELRNNLSRYLSRVRDGEEVVVTERGRAIARVLPLSGERPIDRLIREGKVTPAKRLRRPRPKPVKTNGTVSDLVADQRR